MKIGWRKAAVLLLFFFAFYTLAAGQTIRALTLSAERGIAVESVLLQEGSSLKLTPERPLFTLEINDTLVSALSLHAQFYGKTIRFSGCGIEGSVRLEDTRPGCWKAAVVFRNASKRDLAVSNVVPFGQSPDHVFITAAGPWSLARTRLYRPGLGPVGVILPDNAWELGYSGIDVDETRSLCALSRRTAGQNREASRWKTVLRPGGQVTYRLYAELYSGPWQNGLRRMFQERWLYDLDRFDATLFGREDLKWIRHAYAIGLQFAWDHEFFDARKGGYGVHEYLEMGKRYFGGWDVLGLWPTWPTLGVDQRNQWDLYADMPGGLETLSRLAGEMLERGTRFFIAYNPWDQSTRKADPYRGMAALIRDTGADGVVLDCSGSSSAKLQAAADGVRPGVIMYSEGMAVPVDMPGIVAGRVHDAIYLPPPINLNKLIKPDFAIFRVCQLCQGRLHREFAFSFFNGYGIEMNVFGPGRPDWMEEEYLYLGRLVKILRENSDNFLSPAWTPLIDSRADSVWINRWPGVEKTLYTVLSLRPEGFNGPLFRERSHPDSHFVSLYHHEEIHPDTLGGKECIPVCVNGFDRAWLGTRMEGNVDCIARFPVLLEVRLKPDSLFWNAKGGDSLKLWAGMPSYQNTAKTFTSGRGCVRTSDLFGRYEGKIVLALYEDGRLRDERVVTLQPGMPRLIRTPECTEPAHTAPRGMVRIDGGPYVFRIEKKDSFIPYPDRSAGDTVIMKSYYMDRLPVTNGEFKAFLDATGYVPEDPSRFLTHWEKGRIPRGWDEYPVVYVSLEDAAAYARWAGKRLPTEMEWQYAAQGPDGRLWPWGNEPDSTRCNKGLGRMTPAGSFPTGASPFGVLDMVGNVWQLTADEYDNGSHYFIVMRGGSYYNPTSSWWYVEGGPQQLNRSQILLRVSPGFERNATVGFRCVKDSGT